MNASAIVMGAGVVGTTTAYMLAAQGWRVTVVDKHASSAMEASFANGGQLSYSHAEPWATPTMLSSLLRSAWKQTAPVHVSASPDKALWQWCAAFLWHCRTAKVRSGSRTLLQLAQESRSALAQMLRDIAAHADADAQNRWEDGWHYQPCGALHIYDNVKAYRAAAQQAAYQARYGCRYELLEGDAVYEKEPALRSSNLPLYGALYFPDDAAGDAHQFTQKLAAYSAQQLGVTFLYGQDITELTHSKGVIHTVHTSSHSLQADVVINALGCGAMSVLSPLGIALPLYPMTGYSITVPVNDDAPPFHAPQCAITDTVGKLVYSRLGRYVRAAGFADIGSVSEAQKQARFLQLQQQVQARFPLAGAYEAAEFWQGHRPATPSGVPIIGQARHKNGTPYANLFHNVGHGTLGWTLAAGSAARICQLLNQPLGKN